jgi:hypothetical protein
MALLEVGYIKNQRTTALDTAVLFEVVIRTKYHKVQH